MKKIATAVYCVSGGTHVVMAYQQETVIGLKGYGGEPKAGESLKECARRELDEESGGVPENHVNHMESGGITIDHLDDLELVAVIDFYNGTEEDVSFGGPSSQVFFYRCVKFKGMAISTKEMIHPRLYPIGNLPFDQMIIGDELIIPDVLAGRPIRGYLRRTSDFKKIIDHKINPCESEELLLLEKQYMSSQVQ
ncbi:MAG: NUDIX domain-containing protein [Candidatus Paceibacterota bacterium]